MPTPSRASHPLGRGPAARASARGTDQVRSSDGLGKAAKDGFAIGANDDVAAVLARVRVGRRDPRDGGSRWTPHLAWASKRADNSVSGAFAPLRQTPRRSLPREGRGRARTVTQAVKLGHDGLHDVEDGLVDGHVDRLARAGRCARSRAPCNRCGCVREPRNGAFGVCPHSLTRRCARGPASVPGSGGRAPSAGAVIATSDRGRVRSSNASSTPKAA